FAPDGRLFISEQGGDLKIVSNYELLPTPFVHVNTVNFFEQGLLGIAFDPDFANNGYVYVYYTAQTPARHNRVSRFTSDPDNPDVALPGSEEILLDLPNAGPGNHNGGAIHFGWDGALYIAVGDNATSSNAQTLANPFGKILRINADGTIPEDNPFYVDGTSSSHYIYAFGFRNPYSFHVSPLTGQIFVGDVGSSGAARREEVNELYGGENYGWPVVEGWAGDPRF